MKPFKLNKFEKFIIRRRRLVTAVLFSFYIVSTIVCANLFEETSVLSFIFSTLIFALLMYVNVLPTLKHDKIVKASQKNLDFNYAYNALCEYCTALDPKDSVTSPLFINNKILYLIDMGKYREALEQYKNFFDTFGNQKTPPHILFLAHTGYAILQYELGNFDLSKEHFKVAADFYNVSKTYKKIVIIPEFDEKYVNVQNAYMAYFGDFFPDFENKVLHDLEFKFNGKPKKQISALERLSAYEILFVYFKKFGDTEKAKLYAEKILNTGNEQFIVYHRAKEYLENANKNN